MENQPIRKTQARTLERGRVRQQIERRNTLTRTLPFVIAAAVVLFISIVIFLALNQATPGVVGARLQVDQERIELGNRVFDQSVRATFTIKNIGDETLKLEVPRVATLIEGC